MTLEHLLSQLRFSPAVETALRKKYAKDESTLRTIAETAYSGDDFQFFLCKRMPLTRLAVVTLLLLEKEQLYRQMGTSDEIILDTFRDVSLRANLYYAKTGKAGLTKTDVIWFRHIMNGAIFKIGALQFQPFEMLYLDEATLGEPYMTLSEANKAAFPAGTPVLNCHIQQGADLHPNSVSLSLQQATAFFRTRFPHTDFRAVLCYSWLLYPPMVRQLSTASNIRQFAERFTILGSCSDPSQALENLRHTNGHAPTSLQRLAAGSREQLGFSCGIIRL